MESAMKIDDFIQKQSSYQERALKRRQKDTLIENDKNYEFFFSRLTCFSRRNLIQLISIRLLTTIIISSHSL